MISAKVLAHSKTKEGDELITIQTKAPKFLDAEIEKHRMLSSNSSSDRAIPFSKALMQNFFLPTDVRLDQSGMQGYETLPEKELMNFQDDLIDMREKIIEILSFWNTDNVKIHKQHLNRYLMAFTYQDKVITGNREQFDYFLSLRDNDKADPAMIELAKRIKEAINNSSPVVLDYGEWHLPYVADDEFDDITTAIQCSVARCARVSYLNHDSTKTTVAADIKLAKKLFEDYHFTPFEHQATPAVKGWTLGNTHKDINGVFWSANFKGFVQFRKMFIRSDKDQLTKTLKYIGYKYQKFVKKVTDTIDKDE